MIPVGARIQVTDWSDEYFRAHGTVTVAEHPGVLTGRPMVEVRIDGQTEEHDVGYYVEQVEEQFSLRVAS